MEIFLVAVVVIVIAVVVLALISRRKKSPVQAAQGDLPDEQAKSVDSEPQDLQELQAVHERGQDNEMSSNKPGRKDAIAGEEGKSE